MLASPVSFDLRKFSCCDTSGQWHTYPQRTGVVVLFRPMGEAVTVSVHWKATCLLSLVINPGSSSRITCTAKSPSIGVKELGPHGSTTRRFQVSVANPAQFISLVNTFKYDLGITVREPREAQFSCSQTAFLALSQGLDWISMSQQPQQPYEFMSLQQQPTTVHPQQPFPARPFYEPPADAHTLVTAPNDDSQFLAPLLRMHDKSGDNDGPLRHGALHRTPNLPPNLTLQMQYPVNMPVINPTKNMLEEPHWLDNDVALSCAQPTQPENAHTGMPTKRVRKPPLKRDNAELKSEIVARLGDKSFLKLVLQMDSLVE